MKKLLKEFKEFTLRGNVLNLAIGVIIGAAFQGIVKSLTDDILSPIIGLFTRGNLDSLHVVVIGADIRYGAFITAVINFIIMAFVIFLIVKAFNTAAKPRKKEPEPEPTTKTCPFCKSTIAIDATRCPSCTSALEG